MKTTVTLLSILSISLFVSAAPTADQLARLLKTYPAADTSSDGILTLAEATAYRAQVIKAKKGSSKKSNASKTFSVDPGWDADRFPEHAIAYMTPAQIKEVYAKHLKKKDSPVTSYPKQTNGALRIVGTGHSFMAPGYKTLSKICEAAGFEQPLFTHTGGGVKGSTRYKWEQENGIFQFDGKPLPKLLSSIANAKWEAMMWGPYSNDRPAYYECWIEFCLKYNPDMKFYLSDAWPQLSQLDVIPTSEETLTAELFNKLGKDRQAGYKKMLASLNEKYDGRIFILPTCEAMVRAVRYYHQGKLPGIQGIHKFVGKKERSLWRDQLGHLGPGFNRLEGYVFYATLYARSPELITEEINFGDPPGFPNDELDKAFRKIAWEAVTHDPRSGVTDKNGNGIGDRHE